MSDCFVYVIAIEGQKLAKVGISNNPRSRLEQLSTGSPFQMQLVHCFRFGGRDWARRVEANTHDELAKDRRNGEWFAVSPREAILAAITRIVRMYLWELGWDDDSILEQLGRIGLPDDIHQQFTHARALEKAQMEGVLQ